MKNWAGNLEFKAERVLCPGNVSEIRETVLRSKRIRPIGTRHSFNDIADCPEDLLSVERLDGIVSLTEGAVTVEAGIRYGDLAERLLREGRTLANFASLPHISVGGSVATATHGSGVRNGGLATAVSALEIVRADGTLVRLTREDPDFDGAVVGLGALGVVVRLTLDTVPAFDVAQTVYERLPWKELKGELASVLAGAYSVSLFTSWSSDVIDQVWVKRSSGASTPQYFGAQAADGPRHPLLDMPTENCTEQMGVYGPAHERLPHFRMRFTPSGGEELQSEYILPRDQAFDALLALDAIRDRIAPLLFVSEIRTVAADRLWLSPSYGQDSVCVHFTWRPLEPEVRAILPEIEARLEPFGARPHWGKLFEMKADRVRSLYPRIGDFDELAKEFDPVGKFRNDFLEERVFGR